MPGYRTPADDEREPLSLAEGSRWAFLALVLASSVGYGFVVVPQLATTPVEQIAWQIPMIWAIGVTIVGTIALSIVLAIVTAIVTRREPARSDVRDTQIERHGDRIAQATMAFGSAGVLVLVMLEQPWFVIGNAIYLIGAIGAILGAIASLRVTRGVFRG